jgi:two-component system sensor histidine kinase KdpD
VKNVKTPRTLHGWMAAFSEGGSRSADAAAKRRAYGTSLLLVVAVTLLGIPVRWFIAPTNLVMLYLAVVVWSALFLGRGPSVLASVLSVLAFDFFMVPPFYTFVVNDSEYIITFAGLLSVGLVISSLTSRVREQARAALARERQTQALFELSRDLSAAGDAAAAERAVLAHVRAVFGVSAVLSFGNGAPQERTEGGTILSVPLGEPGTLRGILAVCQDPEHPFDPARRRLLEAFAIQADMALERIRLSGDARDLELLRAREKMQSALLSSISHELRTPLSSIEGVLSTLREGVDGGKELFRLDEAARSELVETAWSEARRMNQLVENLLGMTRLEAGALSLRREFIDVEELLGEVLRRTEDRLAEGRVRMEIPEDLPPLRADFVLLTQALGNVLDNAVKYGGGTSPPEVRVSLREEDLEIVVADRGRGIPEAELERVFEKFHRLAFPGGPGGTGLGLSISRGIVEAHGGMIQARCRSGGGTEVVIRLPVDEERPEEKKEPQEEERRRT